MIFTKDKPQIIITTQTYVDGNLEKDVAKLVEDSHSLWSYVLPFLVALAIFHQVVMT